MNISVQYNVSGKTVAERMVECGEDWDTIEWAKPLLDTLQAMHIDSVIIATVDGFPTDVTSMSGKLHNIPFTAKSVFDEDAEVLVTEVQMDNVQYESMLHQLFGSGDFSTSMLVQIQDIRME